MTFAVCFNCGAMKFGAYVPCGACGVAPPKSADHKYSVLLTDHYLPREALERISKTMRDGGPRPLLPQWALKQLGKDAERYNGTVGRFYEAAEPPAKSGIDVAAEPSTMSHIDVPQWGKPRPPDAAVAERLSKETPLAFKKAKAITGSAEAAFVFSRWSPKMKEHRLKQKLIGLQKALEKDGYRPDLRPVPGEMLIAYFNELVRALPEWRGAYALFDHFIPKFFPSTAPPT
jgi:hypothetical protein